MALQLLNRHGNFVRGRRRFGGTVDDHVCLLLLFDGYRGHRCVRADDRAYFMRTLLNTSPFGAAFRRGIDRSVNGGLLVFSAPVHIPSGSTYRFPPTCDSRGLPTIDPSALETFIDGLSYGSFLDGRSTWLTPGSRSYGMVGVVLNGFSGRDAFWDTTPIPHFVVTGTSRERMARVLLHELGHAFELIDEYEEHDVDCAATEDERFPNVVYRRAIESPEDPDGTSDLLPSSVVIDQVPWARYMSSPVRIIEHPRRADWLAALASSSSFADCTVGRYTEEGGPGAVSLTGLWEGGNRHSFNTYRAQPYCIMRDEYYQLYDPDPPRPVEFRSAGGTAVLTLGVPTIEPADPTAPPTPPPCGPETRDPAEPRRFTSRVGDSFIPYCVACENWIQYRFGITSGSDVDEWQGSHSASERLDAYQRWLTRNG